MAEWSTEFLSVGAFFRRGGRDFDLPLTRRVSSIWQCSSLSILPSRLKLKLHFKGGLEERAHQGRDQGERLLHHVSPSIYCGIPHVRMPSRNARRARPSKEVEGPHDKSTYRNIASESSSDSGRSVTFIESHGVTMVSPSCLVGNRCATRRNRTERRKQSFSSFVQDSGQPVIRHPSIHSPRLIRRVAVPSASDFLNLTVPDHCLCFPPMQASSAGTSTPCYALLVAEPGPGMRSGVCACEIGQPLTWRCIPVPPHPSSLSRFVFQLIWLSQADSRRSLHQ